MEWKNRSVTAAEIMSYNDRLRIPNPRSTTTVARLFALMVSVKKFENGERGLWK